MIKQLQVEPGFHHWSLKASKGGVVEAINTIIYKHGYNNIVKQSLFDFLVIVLHYTYTLHYDCFMFIFE